MTSHEDFLAKLTNRQREVLALLAKPNFPLSKR